MKKFFLSEVWCAICGVAMIWGLIWAIFIPDFIWLMVGAMAGAAPAILEGDN